MTQRETQSSALSVRGATTAFGVTTRLNENRVNESTWILTTHASQDDDSEEFHASAEGSNSDASPRTNASTLGPLLHRLNPRSKTGLMLRSAAEAISREVHHLPKRWIGRITNCQMSLW